ncbi:substrate-binding periplasmic protein [Legionella nagasakiensis]|uniref:substrate-binding periplasmic protein n=1 Tax=Legionella nagasakiensis TaxID=535290 RepID=UPI0010562E60|nr:transporter substrate-binding domain-containing protein [Legionella nagasakiensis]
MVKSFFYKLLIIVGLCLLNSVILAQNSLAPKEYLRVAAIVEFPFVMINSRGGMEGIAIDLFVEMAQRNGWQYQITPVGNNVDKAINELAANNYDVLIGPISINEKRINLVSFGRPFFLSNVKVAINHQQISPLTAIIDLFKNLPARIVVLISFLMFIVANVIWLSERRLNPEMPKRYLRGILYSCWVFTTHFFKGGLFYRPSSVTARLILTFWLVIALSIFLIVSSTYTAYITAKIVNPVYTLRSIEELTGRPIAYVRGQIYLDTIKKVKATPLPRKDINSAIQAVQNKEAFAAISNELTLRHAIRQMNLSDIVVADLNLKNDEFAFAFPINSPYRRAADKILVKMRDSGKIVTICKFYLPYKYEACEF